MTVIQAMLLLCSIYVCTEYKDVVTISVPYNYENVTMENVVPLRESNKIIVFVPMEKRA